MVRETRHLWVGNLPHNIREERILEHFKRYGKVQSVKILPKKDDESGTGVCATVAFIDIKSAAKAHNAENKVEERTLKTDYYEPPASSTASSAIFIHERDDSLVRPTTGVYAAARPPRYQHGLTEDRTYDRATGHYYDRVAEREPYLRRPMGMGYHDDDGYQGRGKSRDRYQRTQTGTGTYQDGPERTPNHFRGHNATRQHFDQQRYPSEQYNDDRETTTSVNRITRRPNSTTTSTVNSTTLSPSRSRSGSRQRHHKRRSPSHSPSGSRSNSRSRSRSRSRSTSGSHSSSSSSKVRSSSSDSSSRSRSPSKSRSPAASYGSQGSNKGGRSLSSVSLANVYLPSAVTTAASNNSQVTSQAQGCMPLSVDSEKEEKRPLGICVKNLPVRSTDTSLKDGLFHEYKKHGKVTMVKVIGQGTDRYAVVCFKKTEDVDKALEVSKDKLFFGCRIEVTAHEGIDGEDNDFRPLEAELDEYHPKATRTLFIGNLEKDITTVELRKHFEQFGEIIEIDIKKQGSSSYAFIQYSDVASVVKAMRKLDGENLGANRIKLGFGKSMPTNCVWLDGITDSVSEKFLARNFSRFGIVCYTSIDREKGHSLIFYESLEYAQVAVSEMRGRMMGGKRLQVDFASRECQNAFFDKMEMTGQILPGERPWERRERRGEFDVIRDDREARVGFDGRTYTRYDNQQRVTRGTFSRGTIQRGAYTKGKGQGFPGRFDPYHEEFGDRWHRNFDEEYSQTGVNFEDSYEHELREYGYSQRERREYANDDRTTRGRSFSPVRRRDAGSTSPTVKERHREEVTDSPHARIDRPAGRTEKYDDHHSRERYNSRDDDDEAQSLDGKNERTKFSDSGDRQIRKKNKHRNSVSDQDSHHSQSPPRSRHQSRSTSPPSKEKKLQKERERGHHRTKSPSSHSSSRMSSPVKDVVATELIDEKDICCDQKDSVKHKISDSKPERDSLSLACLKQDDTEKLQIKSDLESLKKRIHSESEVTDHLLSVSEAAGRIERKKRLLISAGCMLNRDAGFLGNHVKEALDQTSTKIRNIIHGNAMYSKTAKSDSGIDSIIEGAGNEECKSDAESGELLDEVCPVKINTSECANSDLKYLKKKQVHLLHLLEQLGEGMSSSDTECSTDSDKPDKKIRTSGIDSVLCSGREQIKNSIKQEMFMINDTINSKDSSVHATKQKDTYKLENSDSSSLLRNVDSVLLKKYHDPRKAAEHPVIPLPSSSVERTRRFSTEKEMFCHSDSTQIDMNTEHDIHLSSGLPDTTWKKQTFPTVCITTAEDNEQDSTVDSSIANQHMKIKDDDYPLNDVTTSNEGFTGVKSCRVDGRISLNQRSLSESVCPMSHELRREREISPLSLPLPKFAASLRSPKMSPNPLASPKGSAMSPRAGHSPNIVLPGKANFIHEITKVDKTNLKDIQEEKVVSLAAPATLSSQLSKSTIEHTSNSSSLRLSHVLLKPTDMEISSDSEYSPISSPNRPSIEERIRALDEKFNAWSGSSRTFSTLSGDTSPTSTSTTVSTVTTTATIPAVTTTTSTADYLKYNIKKRPRFSFLSPEFRTEPSEIVKSLLAKSTIFDQDSKRLERINEKYEPKEVKLDFTPKMKPLVRTKAAAKEFSIPIQSLSNSVSSLTSLCTTKHSLFTQSAIPTSNPSLAVTTYNSSSSIGGLVMSTQCTVPFVPSFENTPIINKMTENENLVVPKIPLDHVPALSKLLETIKPQSLWKDVTSVTTALPSKPALSCAHSNIYNLHTPISVKDSMCISVKKEPREDKNNQKKEFFTLSCQKDVQCKSDSILALPLLKEHNIKKDISNKENTVKKENILKDIVIKQEAVFGVGQESLVKRENLIKEIAGSGTDGLTLLQSSMPKRRVSSIDSNESDSGRSARSADASKDCHDSGWQKDEQKTETILPEPEHKKLKLSHNMKSSEKEKQREKSTSPIPSRKPEKFPSRMERSKSLGSRSSLPAIERDEIESKSVDMKYVVESRDRIKSETKQKDERKTKCKETKGNRHEHRTKSKWSDSSRLDKSDKLGQTNIKGRKDHDKFERERNKSERKLSGNDKGKHDLQRSKSKSELKHNLFEEEPVYFSMYDKVKARSSQNQTLKDQAKDLETVRQKFNLLKQSRAKREEKSRSVEMDSDKDSDASHHSSESETQMRTSSKTKQSRKRKLVIESSSDEDAQSQNTRTEGSRNDCRDTSNEFPSDLEVEFRELTSVKKFNVTHNTKRKGKRTGLSDSGSSGSEEQSNNKTPVTAKKKTKINQSMEKLTKRHNQKSDYDTSDTEIIPKSQTKEKEHKKRKTKKEKMFEVTKSDSEGSENEMTRKFKEDDKLLKCRSFKECEDETSSVAEDNVSRIESKEHSGVSSEKSKSDSKSVESADKEAKHKSTSKKKKKSKKSSKMREKKLSEKPSELNSYPQMEEEHTKLQDKEDPKQVPSISPKAEPYSREITPLSPPCLRTAVLSDIDFKSDFSDFEFDSQKIKNTKLNSDLWKPIEPKMDTDIDISVNNPNSSSKCETENFVGKDRSDNPQSETETCLPSFLEKTGEYEVDETTKSLIVHTEQGNECSEKSSIDNSFSPLTKEVKAHSLKKDDIDKKEINEVDVIKKREKGINDTEKGKEERKKKKSKKTQKEKRKKSKSEHSDEVDITPYQQPVAQASAPVFEKLSLIDDDSRLSNIRLDEEIAEEARRLEQELLAAASEETSTFGDSEDPCKKEEKSHERRFESSNRKEEKQERRFEEEAAKETRRLEEELLSTARDPWNLKATKLYDDDSSHELQILTEPVTKETEIEVDTANRKEDNIYMGIELATNSNIGISHPSSQDFLLAPVDSDQYKLEDKEAVYDMDNQRKIEDDLAVSALLQEMNNEEVSAPELTKESDYLEPLLESQDNALNYLIPDETTNSLQIAEPSPEITVEENVPEAKSDIEPECVPQEGVASEQVSSGEIAENGDTELPTEDTIVECKVPIIEENSTEKIQSNDVVKQQETETKLPTPEPTITESAFLENEYALLEAPVSHESLENKILHNKKQTSMNTDEKETNPYNSNEETSNKENDTKLTFEDVTADTMIDGQSKKENPPTLERIDTGNEESSAISEISIPAENEETKLILDDCINENTNLLDNEEQNVFLSSDPVLDLGDDTRTASPPSYPALEEEINSIREEISETKDLFSAHNICASNIEQLFSTDKSHDIGKEVEAEKQEITENVEQEIVKTIDNNIELVEETHKETTDLPTKANEEAKVDESLEQSSSTDLAECCEKETTVELNSSNLFDEPLSIVTDQEEKKQNEKPKRGRRPKTRKHSESSVSLIRHEVSSNDIQMSNKGNKRGRPTSMERSRRSLRSETAEIFASEQHSSDNLHIREDGGVNPIIQENLNMSPGVSNTDCNIQASCTDDIGETTDETNNVEEREVTQLSNDVILCCKANEHAIEQSKEEPRKRGRRRKKGSSDHHSSYFSPPSDKNDSKLDETDQKDHHKPKESRLWLSISSDKTLSEHKLGSKETSSAYDVFEFRDSDEEITFERDLQSSMKERLLDSTRPSYGHDHRHHDSKSSEIPHEKEKKHDESRHKSHHHDDRDTTGKEYVTELSQHGKISITIRLHQKEGHDGSSTGTAEVVKTSEAVCAEEHKMDSSRSDKSNTKDSPNSDNRSIAQGRSIRKSTRLQCQNARTTVDEVIEEVVKGHFKSAVDSLGPTTPIRVTRRTRSRRSEEIANQQSDDINHLDSSTSTKAKNEPVFVILDNTVKDYSTEVKKCLISSQDVISSKTTSTIENEPSKSETKMSLRSYRITRSSARMEANRENLLSPKSSQDLNKEPANDNNHSISWTAKNENHSAESGELSVSMVRGKDTPSENLQTRAPLPVLKVELPKVTSSDAKAGENDDSDSRSSPTVLIDPVTGFLTPVSKNADVAEGHLHVKGSRTQHSEKLSSVITNKILTSTSIDSSIVTHSSELLGPLPDVVVKKCSVDDSSHSNRTCLSPKVISSIHQATSASAPVSSGSSTSQTTPTHHITETRHGSESRIHQTMNEEEKSEKSIPQTVINTPSVHPMSTYSEIKVSVSGSTTAKSLPPVGQPQVSIGQAVGWPGTSLPGSPYHAYGSVPTQPAVASQSVKTRSSAAGYSQSTRSTVSLPTATSSPASVSDTSFAKIMTPQKVLPPSNSTMNITSDGESKIEGTTTTTAAAAATSPTTTTTVTVAVSQPDICTVTASESLSSSERAQINQSAQLQSHSKVDVSGSWSVCKTPPSRSLMSSSETSRHTVTAPSISPPRTTSAIVSTAAIKTEHHCSQQIASAKIKTPYAGTKQSAAFLHKPGLPVPAYEAATHSSHGLVTSNNSGGVIAELLQNPQLLQQQHKDYFAASQQAVSNSAQIGDRLPAHLVRPASSTPTMPTDLAARLGNPTPPHTPTPPVTSATHPLQPSDIHPAHVAAGIHLRQSSLIVPSHPPLGIHSELNAAFVHQQMMYAASHPHYAAIHPELRAQQEAQARAAAMGIAPRFPYPHVPPNAAAPGGFRQPPEPRQHISMSDSKSDAKPLIESSKTVQEHRLHEEREKSSQPMKVVRIKQEFDRDVKGHSALRIEEHEPTGLEVKQLSAPSGPLTVGGLRPPHVPYPPSIRHPHLSISTHERITDSPVVANLYAQGQLRTTPLHLVVPSDENHQHKVTENHQHSQVVKTEMTDKDTKPPIAHQNPPTTVPYHSLDALSHHRQSSMSMPSVGSPAPGYLEGRPVAHLAHSSGALTLKTLVPPLPVSQTHSLPSETRSSHEHKKTRAHSHQGPSQSPGLNTAHSPLPVLPNFPSHSPHPTAVPSHAFPPPNGEPIHRRGSLHLIPQMGSEAPIHAPPPAHAMSQPAGVPRTQPQTPPHASQVPPQGDSFLLQRYPVMWQGLLALKNDQAAVQMHFVSGNPRIARASLPPMTEGGTPPVRIAQRMRLEQTQLEGVARKMQMVDEHCILLALPCGRDHMDVLQQSNNLRNGFINYLQLKQAAGIVNAAAPGSQQPAYVIHIFPSCEFSNENMARIAPDLLHSVSDIAHLLIIIATV